MVLGEREWQLLWPGRPCKVGSPLSPEDAVAVLLAARASGQRVTMLGLAWSSRRVVTGDVVDASVRLVALRPVMRNSWRPVMTGSVHPMPSGSELRGCLRVPSAVRIFTSAWFGLLAMFGLVGLTATIASAVTAHWVSVWHGLAFTAAVIGMAGSGAAIVWAALRSGAGDADYLAGWLVETFRGPAVDAHLTAG